MTGFLLEVPQIPANQAISQALLLSLWASDYEKFGQSKPSNTNYAAAQTMPDVEVFVSLPKGDFCFITGGVASFKSPPPFTLEWMTKEAKMPLIGDLANSKALLHSRKFSLNSEKEIEYLKDFYEHFGKTARISKSFGWFS